MHNHNLIYCACIKGSRTVTLTRLVSHYVNHVIMFFRKKKKCQAKTPASQFPFFVQQALAASPFSVSRHPSTLYEPEAWRAQYTNPR